MGAYIVRRLLLIIPTLFGIMLVNFALVQFVPGGPVEQAIARLQGGGDVFEGFAGSGDDAGGTTGLETNESEYIGARGLPPEFIAELEREFGFDKPPVERFLNMMWNYVTLDFGESYFRSVTVIELIREKLPVEQVDTVVSFTRQFYNCFLINIRRLRSRTHGFMKKIRNMNIDLIRQKKK